MNIRDVQRKLDVITDNLEKLEQLASKSFKDFSSDFRNSDSVLHRMQTSIQALLDIGSYVIASRALRTPDTNAEVVEILAEAGIVPSDKTEVYIKMSQFRNRIVHLYNHIDTGTLYDILTHELTDIKDFLGCLLDTFR
ncbi:MAG: DUF86 domain-containing protein [Armatimonadetes bacterium]|nr:DUF86 domain-containing protein [Armatimonadota bacterium]